MIIIMIKIQSFHLYNITYVLTALAQRHKVGVGLRHEIALASSVLPVCRPYNISIDILCNSNSKCVCRVEGVSRSPVFSHVSATMAGLPTVRACSAEEMLRIQFDDKQDIHTAAWYTLSHLR